MANAKMLLCSEMRWKLMRSQGQSIFSGIHPNGMGCNVNPKAFIIEQICIAWQNKWSSAFKNKTHFEQKSLQI